MAYRDAYLSHRRQGIYGEMFFSAAISAAFAVKDPIEAIQIGLTEIPKECALAHNVRWALKVAPKIKNYRQAREAVDKRFQGMSGVHTINNACLTIWGLTIGGTDFTKVISETVAMGLDNDCTAATAGSMVGAVVGQKGIPKHWTRKFNNTVYSYLIKRKGLAFAIRALAKLPPHVSLLIVGKGNRTPYEQLARKLAVANRIRFAGTSNDMTAIYNAADLLVHPAIYEPFGLVCAEALACGLPVVTTLVTGAAELITPGINGNIVDDPSDSAALAAAIQPFLNRHNVAETALAARRAAESVEFSSTLEQTLTLLEQFLSANHSAPNPAGD